MVPLPQVAPTCSVLDPGGQSVPPASPLLPPGPQTLRLHPGCEALPSSDVPALPCQLCQGHKLLWGGGLAHSNPLPSSGHLAHPTPLRPHGWLPNRSPLPVQGSWPPMSCPASVDSQVTWTRTWGHAESLLTHSSWLQSCLVHLHSAALGAGSLAAACPCPGPLQGPPGGGLEASPLSGQPQDQSGSSRSTPLLEKLPPSRPPRLPPRPTSSGPCPVTLLAAHPLCLPRGLGPGAGEMGDRGEPRISGCSPCGVHSTGCPELRGGGPASLPGGLRGLGSDSIKRTSHWTAPVCLSLHEASLLETSVLEDVTSDSVRTHGLCHVCQRLPTSRGVSFSH